MRNTTNARSAPRDSSSASIERRDQQSRPQVLRPRDAATLVIVDRSGARPRLLMGRRPADAAFLPGTYVFPGGRVERPDARTPLDGDLNEVCLARLQLGTRAPPSLARARALAVAALRETYEETGVLIAAAGAEDRTVRGARWEELVRGGLRPSLSGLMFLARAITPPGRPRRFDTRFFLTTRDSAVATTQPPDGELEDISWLTVDEAEERPLPTITRLILRDVLACLEAASRANPGRAYQWSDPLRPVPLYRTVRGSAQRVLLSHKWPDA